MDMNVKCTEVVTNIEGSQLTATLKNADIAGLDKDELLEELSLLDIMSYLTSCNDTDDILEHLEQKEIASYCDEKGLL